MCTDSWTCGCRSQAVLSMLLLLMCHDIVHMHQPCAREHGFSLYSGALWLSKAIMLHC
jgi:hypothetical protein